VVRDASQSAPHEELRQYMSIYVGSTGNVNDIYEVSLRDSKDF
jgi:hypothetical protein